MKFHHYTVKGRGIFPLDMLRYDACWPRDSKAVEEIGNRELRSLDLTSNQPPSKERWSSFGWHVIKNNVY